MVSEVRYVIFAADDLRAIFAEQDFLCELAPASGGETASQGRHDVHWLARWCGADPGIEAVLIEVLVRGCQGRGIVLPRAGAKGIEPHGDGMALKIWINADEVVFEA